MPEGFFQYKQISEDPEELDYQNLLPCPHCGKKIPQDAIACYYCGEPVEFNAKKSGGFFWAVVILIIVFLVYLLLRW